MGALCIERSSKDVNIEYDDGNVLVHLLFLGLEKQVSSFDNHFVHFLKKKVLLVMYRYLVSIIHNHVVIGKYPRIISNEYLLIYINF